VQKNNKIINNCLTPTANNIEETDNNNLKISIKESVLLKSQNQIKIKMKLDIKKRV
jgi:hypothetical protein